MTLLLDSNAVLWTIYDRRRLTPFATDLITDKRNILLFSDASLWEISLKVAKGKLIYESSQHTFHQRIADLGVTPLPITAAHIRRAVSLPPHHADPFDRLLIAQAQMEDVPFVSADRDVRSYNIKVLWH